MSLLTHYSQVQLKYKHGLPHVLVVDDESFNRRLIQRILSQYCTITEAEDGYIALELIQQNDFDLVILDIMMPKMHGLEVLAGLRQHATGSELPVILVSALNENNDIVTGLQAGANDYIPKPIDAEVVLARVNTQLQLKAAMDIQKKATLELEKADALKNKLFSIASHDLKSPLSSIYMAEALLRDMMPTDDPAISSVLDTLKETVDNMNDIIIEFLDMAMLQSGKVSMDVQPVELKELIDNVIQQYQLQSQEKGSVITGIDTDGYVLADYARLKQILSNLISNGLKYSPANSEIKVNLVDKDGFFIIEVIDQGPGIPTTERDKLFTEFGKLSTRPTAGESSTGLGLWIVKQMTEAMNGQVGVRCPLDGGSIFWVRLPKA